MEPKPHADRLGRQRPDLDRAAVLKILESGFYHAAEIDYAQGHIHNEEDVRAATYRHVRAAFDLIPNWRLLTNVSAFTDCEDSSECFRPDFAVFHRFPDADKDKVEIATIEIFAEIKHWPSEAKIVSDLEKLVRLREIYTPERPDIAFFAILGHGFNHTKVAALNTQLLQRFQANIWLVPHWDPKWGGDGSLYKGPWVEAANLDPWRARLRHFQPCGESLIGAGAT